MIFELILLTAQCSDLWMLKEGVDVEGLQYIADALAAVPEPDTPCPGTLKPRVCFTEDGTELAYFQVVSMGNTGTGSLDVVDGALVLVVEWDKAFAAPVGSCVTITIPDEEVENDCPEVKEVKECCPPLNIALLDCNNELAGFMSFDTLIACIRKQLTLGDFLDPTKLLDAPDADLQLIGVKGFTETPDPDRGCGEGVDTGVYLLNATDLCCEPVPDVEPDCGC